MNKIIIVLGGIVLLGAIIYAIKGRMPALVPATTGKVQVIASFYPIYFFASQIGGDKAEVANITPAGAEPHDYEPTTREIAKISKSRILVLNGGKLESWGDKIKDQLVGTDVYVVTAGEGLTNKEIDPHIWLDPILAKKEAGKIAQGFATADPSNALYYEANDKKLTDEFAQLDADFKNGLKDCRKNYFVTSHAAFGYLASQYGIGQVAISGVSPDQEPSPQKIAEITDLVKKDNIKVIFFESLVSPKLAQTIAGETGVQTMVLDPLEGISDNDLRAGKTYFTVMRQNLNNLKIALECQ